MTVLPRKQESRFRSPEAGSLLDHVVILKSVDRHSTSVPYSVRPEVLQTAGPFEHHVRASSWFLMRAPGRRHCKKSPSLKHLKSQCSCKQQTATLLTLLNSTFNNMHRATVLKRKECCSIFLFFRGFYRNSNFVNLTSSKKSTNSTSYLFLSLFFFTIYMGLETLA